MAAEVRKIRQVLNSQPGKLHFYFAWLSLEHQITKAEALVFLRLQLQAGFKYVRLFFPSIIALSEMRQWITEARQMLQQILRELKKPETSRILMPTLDMNTGINNFRPIYQWLLKESFIALGFVYRRPDANNRATYLHLYRSDDKVFRHVSNITWRRTTLAIPLVLHVLGFDSFAFVTVAAPVNQLREGAETIHDIEQDVLKMFNSIRYSMDYINNIPPLVCHCVVHKGQDVHSNVRSIMQTGRSALFASNHDIHGINLEYEKLISGRLTKKGLARKAELVTHLSTLGIDLNQSQLP